MSDFISRKADITIKVIISFLIIACSVILFLCVDGSMRKEREYQDAAAMCRSLNGEMGATKCYRWGKEL